MKTTRALILSGILASILTLPGVATAGVETKETVRAMDFFKRFISACQKNDQNRLWSEFSARSAFQDAPQEYKDELFKFHCNVATPAALKQLETYDYYIKPVMGDDGKEKEGKSVLCKSPKGTDFSRCQEMFGVVIENGQIKRDDDM